MFKYVIWGNDIAYRICSEIKLPKSKLNCGIYLISLNNDILTIKFWQFFFIIWDNIF